MAIVNTNKPTTAIVNSSKVSHEETWDSNTTTWNTEVRTWNDMGSKFTNTTRVSSSIINQAKP